MSSLTLIMRIATFVVMPMQGKHDIQAMSKNEEDHFSGTMHVVLDILV